MEKLEHEASMQSEELIGLAAVLNVLAVGAQNDIATNGHMQADPRQSPAYAKMVRELVRRGVLPSDDIFAPTSRAEDRLARDGIGGAMRPSSFEG